MWKSYSTDRLREAGPSAGGQPIKVWPCPAPAALEQPGFREAQIARRADDEMVVHGNVQETPGVDQLARDGPVIRAGRGVAARVVVGDDDARRAKGDGEPEHFAGMHEGGIEDPPRDFLDGDHAGLRVEHDHEEHFYEFSGRALAQEVDRVLWAPHLDRLRLRGVHFLDQADPGGP